MRKYLFLLLILAGCDREETGSRKNPEVPDLSAIIEKQALLLDSLNAGAYKIIAIEEETDSIFVSEVDWEEELEIFKEADVSEMRYRSAYEKLPDDSGAYVLRLKEGYREPVQFLRYMLSGDRISAIEAKIVTNNLLYSREIWLRLEFGEKQGEWLVCSYRVVGMTNVILIGERIYSVTGKPVFEE